MNQETVHGDQELRERLHSACQERAEQRRHLIAERIAAGEFDQRTMEVGLKAFHGICDKWAIGASAAQKILFGDSDPAMSEPEVLERISYTMRIYGLVNDVVQGEVDRQQRWLRRAMASLDGKRPIDLMVSGPLGSAKVMEYLQHAKLGKS